MLWLKLMAVLKLFPEFVAMKPVQRQRAFSKVSVLDEALEAALVPMNWKLEWAPQFLRPSKLHQH